MKDQYDVQQLKTLFLAERDRLLETLVELDDEAWRSPSLCEGWSIRDVVAHLLMPYEMSVPALGLRLLAARLSFDRAADRWAQRDQRTSRELLDALSATGDLRFGPRGTPPRAELSHLVSHSGDVLRPLGVEHRVDPLAAEIVLDELVSRGRRLTPPRLIETCTILATDIDWRHGSGPELRGRGADLIVTLCGRTAALNELSGPGARTAVAILEPTPTGDAADRKSSTCSTNGHSSRGAPS